MNWFIMTGAVSLDDKVHSTGTERTLEGPSISSLSLGGVERSAVACGSGKVAYIRQYQVNKEIQNKFNYLTFSESSIC